MHLYTNVCSRVGGRPGFCHSKCLHLQFAWLEEMSLHPCYPCYHGRHHTHLCHFGWVLVRHSHRLSGCRGSRSQSRCFVRHRIQNLSWERGSRWGRGGAPACQPSETLWFHSLINHCASLHFEFALCILYISVTILERTAVLLPLHAWNTFDSASWPRPSSHWCPFCTTLGYYACFCPCLEHHPVWIMNKLILCIKL